MRECCVRVLFHTAQLYALTCAVYYKAHVRITLINTHWVITSWRYMKKDIKMCLRTLTIYTKE